MIVKYPRTPQVGDDPAVVDNEELVLNHLIVLAQR